MTEYALCSIGPGTLLRDQRIPDSSGSGLHPHEIDIYVPPSNHQHWIVLLHGGGGSKFFFARATNVVRGPTIESRYVNWQMLWEQGIGVAIVNGQRCSGQKGPFNPYGVNTISAQYPDGIRTWSNRVFWSQANDQQMLKDLAAYLEALVPGKTMVLAGHSSGGIMVQRMWFDEPEHFDEYFTVAGPAAPDYDPIFGTLGLPAVRKPLYEMLGAKDYNVGVVRADLNVFAPIWYAPPENFTRCLCVYRPGVPPSETPSTYSGSWAQFKRRVQAERPAAAFTGGSPTFTLPAKIGGRLIWQDSGVDSTPASRQYVFEVLTESGHAWLSNRRKPENAPGHSQCRGFNVLKYVVSKL